jgi:hypothetical protein
MLVGEGLWKDLLVARGRDWIACCWAGPLVAGFVEVASGGASHSFAVVDRHWVEDEKEGPIETEGVTG